MPHLPARSLLAASLLAASTLLVSADEVSDKQLKAATANLDKAQATGITPVETTNLIVCAAVPEARAKALAANVQKVHDLARKTLEYAPDEQPWKGKLTLYLFTDRRPFQVFALKVEQRRPDGTESFALKSDEPYVAAVANVTDRATDGDLLAEAGPLVAAALMVRKGGAADYPDWIKAGFGKAATYRADPNGKKTAEYKAKVRAAVFGGKGKPPATVGGIAAAGRGPDTDVQSASLLEYLAFGPGKANFGKFLGGFKPNENNTAPTVDQALEAAGWKADALEAAWRKWVQTGR